ncbi:MAG: hypothetical protein BWK76_08235 [Desulfobulbaceae bacterium A2]|nr:MAG: hypothetical protein BWK76_08235 [Desulfobulbaceae bacterium A2]
MKQDARGVHSMQKLVEENYLVPPVVENGGIVPEQVPGKGTTGSVEGKSKIPTKTILEVLAGILALVSALLAYFK